MLKEQQDATKVKRRKRKERDPAKPKRPQTAFLFYFEKKRAQMADKGFKGTEAVSCGGGRWRWSWGRSWWRKERGGRNKL